MNSPSNYHCALILLAASATFALSACDDGEPAAAAGSQPPGAGQAPMDPQNAAVNDIIRAEARNQAAGLGQGRVIVHGAWNYTGYSSLTPLPEARLVAVDVTIVDHTKAFDYDDIEIVDAALGISYGSDPYLALLDSEGKLEKDPGKRVQAPGPTRILLIYGFPRDSKIFHLVYWGKQLTFDPISPAESGWEIPYPSEPSNPAPAPSPAQKAE